MTMFLKGIICLALHLVKSFLRLCRNNFNFQWNCLPSLWIKKTCAIIVLSFFFFQLLVSTFTVNVPQQFNVIKMYYILLQGIKYLHVKHSSAFYCTSFLCVIYCRHCFATVYKRVVQIWSGFNMSYTRTKKNCGSIRCNLGIDDSLVLLCSFR